MWQRFRKVSACAILLVALSVCGCTEEKAKALKLCADQFRVDCLGALQAIRSILQESIRVPKDDESTTLNKLVYDVETTEQVDAATLGELLKEGRLGQEALGDISQEFDKLEASYVLFASMFRSLPQGNWFAGDAVRKAEKHALSLTLEMLSFAKYLEKHPVQLTGRRVVLIEQWTAGRKLQDKEKRTLALQRVAIGVHALRGAESLVQSEAIAQCLIGAETGRKCLDLIRNYERMNVGDTLTLIRENLSFADEIARGRWNVAGLLGRYKTIEVEIRNDPYYSTLINRPQ